MNLYLVGAYTDRDVHRLIVALNQVSSLDRIVLNLSELRYCEIAPLTMMLGVVRGWINSGKEVEINTRKGRGAHSYLQRINFFLSCGLELREDFIRHDEKGRFVPFQVIDNAAGGLADQLGEKVAGCIAPEPNDIFTFSDQPSTDDGYYESLAYSVSELVKNVQQHSKGIGYLVAQYYPSSGYTQVAIVDDGIGVRNSFSDSGSPHATAIACDLDAILLAIKAKVSSKNHYSSAYASGGPENAGVGLSLLAEIAVAAGGAYTLVSGTGLLSSFSGAETLDISFPGTFVCFSFKRDALDNFQSLLENAKVSVLGELESVISQQEIDGLFNRS